MSLGNSQMNFQSIFQVSILIAFTCACANSFQSLYKGHPLGFNIKSQAEMASLMARIVRESLLGILTKDLLSFLQIFTTESVEGSVGTWVFNVLCPLFDGISKVFQIGTTKIKLGRKNNDATPERSTRSSTLPV